MPFQTGPLSINPQQPYPTGSSTPGLPKKPGLLGQSLTNPGGYVWNQATQGKPQGDPNATAFLNRSSQLGQMAPNPTQNLTASSNVLTGKKVPITNASDSGGGTPIVAKTAADLAAEGKELGPGGVVQPVGTNAKNANGLGGVAGSTALSGTGGGPGVTPPPASGVINQSQANQLTGGNFQQPQYGPNNQATLPNLVNQAANQASQPGQYYTGAMQQALAANEALKQSRIQEANALAANAGNPIPLEFQQGRGQILQNQYLSQQQGIASELQGSAALAGASTAQQGVQQQGTLGAAGLTMPQNYGITSTPYNPVTGQFGTMPGGSGGAFGGGERIGQVGLGEQFAQVLQPAYNAAGAIKNSAQQFLQQNPDINRYTLNIGNQLDQWARTGNFSDPKYTKLNQFLNEFLTTSAPLVGAMGGMTNFKTQIVQSFLDSTAKGSSISEAMDNMYNIMGQKLESIRQSGGQGMTTSSAGSTTGGSNQFGGFFGGK